MRKGIKKLLTNVTIVAVLLTCNTGVGTEAYASVTKNLDLDVGETYKISSSDKIKKATSSKPGVAIVDDGAIQALAVGNTTINITIGSKKTTYKVYVRQTSDKKYKKQSYHVGKKFEDGYYVLYNTSDTDRASYAVFEGKEVNIYNTISTDTFKYNAIVEVKKGQTLYMEGCYAKEFSQAIVRPVGEGTFLVGTHIKEGKYKVKSINSSVAGMYVITSGWNSENQIDAMGLGSNSEVEIEVKNGQYLTIVGCKIISE